MVKLKWLYSHYSVITVGGPRAIIENHYLHSLETVEEAIGLISEVKYVHSWEGGWDRDPELFVVSY